MAIPWPRRPRARHWIDQSSATESQACILGLLALRIAFGMRMYQPGKNFRLGEPQPADNFLHQEAWLDLGGRRGLQPVQTRIRPGLA